MLLGLSRLVTAWRKTVRGERKRRRGCKRREGRGHKEREGRGGRGSGTREEREEKKKAGDKTTSKPLGGGRGKRERKK